MSIKLVLYIFIIPVCLWSVEGLALENIFHKNKINQLKILYILISFSLSYLVTNFFIDFMDVFRIM